MATIAHQWRKQQQRMALMWQRNDGIGCGGVAQHVAWRKWRQA